MQLNDLARAAVDMLGYSLRSHGITTTLALDAHLPTVMADGDQLGQVVLNLLVNAQQALAQVPQAQRQIAVSTGVEQRRDDAPARELRVWLRVADQGPGRGRAAPRAPVRTVLHDQGRRAGHGAGPGGVAFDRPRPRR